MESILQNLSNLSKSARLVSTEQVLMTNVSLLDDFLNEGLSENQIESIESVLFSLFSINKFEFSAQCSLYIASKITYLYKLKKNPQLYDVTNFAITNPSTSTIFCAGYICKYIGSKSKTQLPHFADFLLKQKIELSVASLYALRCCFKAACGSLDSYLQPAFDYARKLVLSNTNLLVVNTNCDPFHQAVISMSIKLLKELIKIAGAPLYEFLDFAKQIYGSYKFPLLHDDIANLVARCACAPLYPKLNKKLKEKAEFSISNFQDTSDELNEPLETIKNFGKMTTNILRHFLNMLTPTLVARSSVPLFHFLRANCSQLKPNLIPILPIDTKFNLFTEVVNEGKIDSEQLQLLILLCPDSSSISEAASVALLLASSNEKAAQKAADEFFASFSKTHPVVTLSYLRTSLVFLAHPPELERDIEKELHGNACIATTILANIPRIEDALIQNEQTIVDYINDVFTAKNASSVRFADAFKFLSILDSLPVKESLVSDAVITAVDYLMSTSHHDKKWRLLLKNVLHFRTKFIEVAQNNLLVVAALSTTKSNNLLTRSILIDLEKLVPLSSNIEGWASETVRRVVESAKSIQPNQELIKKFILRPLPTGNDLLKFRSLGMRKEKKAQDNLEKMIVTFPSLFDTCSLNEKTELIKILLNDKKPVSYLFVLQLFRAIPQKMPKRAYTVLLKKLNDKNLMILEILADTISLYYNYDKTIMPVVFNFIEENSKKGTNVHGSCILLSSLFAHSQVAPAYISRSIILLNSFMKMGSSVPFAMHAINSMFIRHSMELTSLGIGMNEFSVLFEILNQSLSLQPVVLHLCSELFSFLVEINSSNIKAVENFVKISLQAINFTPIDFAKEAYLNCARSIITFAQGLKKFVQIRFPSSISASIPTELAACSAFSDLLKFENKIDLKLSKSVQIALNLLQKTSDERASSFIIALASSKPNLEFWIDLIRRILLVNSVFDSNASKIEPNQIVKVTFLEVTKIVLPDLASQFDLKTEYLDDIISAICQAIGTERVIIQDAAFPVLNKLINLFRNRRSENGGRLLDLYDVQFVSAVKIGFTLNLTTSGEFLSTYLSFRMQVVSEDTSNQEILDVYVPGLQNCQQRTSNYFSLVLDLCIVARRFDNIAELIKPFLKKVVPIFATIVLRSMKIKQKDWRDMSKFRSLVSSFYEQLPSNFVWLQYLAKCEVIDINVLLSFFIVELKIKNNEDWKSNGALNAIPVAFNYFGEKIKPELIDETIKIIAHLPQSNLVIDILKMASRLIKDNDQNQGFENLRLNILSLAMKVDFFIPEVFAHVLYKDKLLKLNPYSVAIGAHFIIQIQKGFEASRIVPLFKILFDHSPEVIGIILTVVLSKLDSNFDPIKIQIVTIALTSNGVDHVPLNLISRFAVQSFEQPTGIHMVSTILLKNPEVGIAILSQNVAKVSFLLADNDLENCRNDLRFIRLCLEVMLDNTNKIATIDSMATKFSLSIVELIFNVANKFGNDPQKGPQIVLECVFILRLIRDKKKKELQELFESKDKTEIEEFVSMIQKHINKANLRHKNNNLTVFSGNARTSKYDEWQSLTIGDYSSDED
ncbi:hypothetical protein M9Y10_009786 [Tritrichomonas musculus]|uniref:Uncharacterized protein n=1 Tax=Tritrichomonas musculus TaxID=1915356 RepID=A0ABR2IPC7_9EUKA